MNLNKKPLVLLLVSFNVSALTPAPAQPPAIFLENQTNLQAPAATAPAPAQPVEQQRPAVQPDAQKNNQPMPSPAQSAPAPVQATASSKPEEPSYGKQIQDLSEEIELLNLKKKKGELQEEINKHGGNTKKDSSHTSEPERHESNMDITVHSIYGVNRTYTAVIYYRGVEMVVRPGSEINGDWKVTSVTATTVKIKKAGKTKTLSLSAAALPSVQPQPQLPVSPVPQQPGFGLLNRTGQ
jgi:type IV pilus biogenesis protein PilP